MLQPTGSQRVGDESVTGQQQQRVYWALPSIGPKISFICCFSPLQSFLLLFPKIDHRVDIGYRANYNEDRVVLKANKHLTGTMTGEIITLYFPEGRLGSSGKEYNPVFSSKACSG